MRKNLLKRIERIVSNDWLVCFAVIVELAEETRSTANLADLILSSTTERMKIMKIMTVGSTKRQGPPDP
jgi:hypothetical protein